MFELPEDKKQASRRRRGIGALIGVFLLALGTLLYVVSRPGAKAPEPVASTAAAPIGEADPVRDLRVLRATMGKDRTGTWAVWSIALRNKSTGYTYSDIQYETTYIGADDRPVLVNRGTLQMSIEPGEEKDTSELRDALFPTGAVWYKFRLVGAKATVR